MTLLDCYTQYKQISLELDGHIAEWMRQETLPEPSRFMPQLVTFRQQLEALLEALPKDVNEEEAQDLKDLNYLALDSLFLVIDLIQYTEHEAMGRCQMRMVNYIGKKRRYEAQF